MHDLETIVELFEDDAVIVVQPGMIAQGKPSIRTFFEGVLSLKPNIQYDVDHIMEAGDIALFTVCWRLEGPVQKSSPVAANNYQSTLLRRQANGEVG
jgi:ketosteroid isomerase-like protein